MNINVSAQGAVATYNYTVCVMDNIEISDPYAVSLSNEDRLASLLDNEWKTYETVLEIKSQKLTSCEILTTSLFDKSYPALYHSFYEGINGVAHYRSVAYYITIQAPTGVNVANAPSEMLVGEEKYLQVKLTGTYPSFKGNAYFSYERSSSNPNVADFTSGTNTLVAKTPGETNITIKAYIKNSKYNKSYYIGSKSFSVTVKDNSPESISMNTTKLLIGVGESFKLNYSVLPIGVSNDVTWKSDNPEVAAVSSNGTVTGVKTGTTTVTATTKNGLSASCKVEIDNIHTIDGIRYRVFHFYNGVDLTYVMPLLSGKYSGNITIPEQIEINDEKCTVRVIAPHTFKDCTELESINLPSTIHTIEQDAFSGCTKLQSIRLINVSNIGSSAFMGCTGLKTIQFIMPNFAVFDQDAFKNCTNLKKVYIDNLLSWISSTISGNALGNPIWPAKAELYVQGEKVVNLTIPAAYEIWGSSFATFGNCSSIETVTLSEGIEVMKRGRTFQGCSNLKEITLPSTLNSIRGYSFAYCPSLETVNCYATTPPDLQTGWDDEAFDDYYAFSHSHPENIILHVPRGCVSAYASAPGWNKFGIILDDLQSGIESITADDEDSCNNVYNLQGILIKQKATKEEVNSLPSGIYIIGGKKRYVK